MQMSRKSLIIAVVLACAYIALIPFGLAVTNWMHMPDWWYPTFGRNNISALVWLQLEHSVGIAVAALPVAVLASFTAKSDWWRITLIAAFIATAIFAFDVNLIRLWETSQRTSTYFVSGLIDVAKIFVFFVCFAYVIRLAMPSNEPLHPRPDGD